MSVAVIFGGTGFIGVHFAELLLQKKAVERVLLADVKPLGDRHISNYFRQEQNQGKIKYIQCDVRQPVTIDESEVLMNLHSNLKLDQIHDPIMMTYKGYGCNEQIQSSEKKITFFDFTFIGHSNQNVNQLLI